MSVPASRRGRLEVDGAAQPPDCFLNPGIGGLHNALHKVPLEPLGIERRTVTVADAHFYQVRPPLVFIVRRAGIVSVAVTFTNLALPVVDEQFGALIPRDIPRGVNGLGLRVVDRCEAAVVLAPHGPVGSLGYYMLVFRHCRWSFSSESGS